MKKIFSSILISFILIINLVLPISVLAATPDLLSISSYTGPENEEVTLTDPMDFSVIFGAPSITKEVDPPNKNYNVFFQANCLYSNGSTFKMPTGDEKSGAHYIISNQSKFEAGKLGGLTKIWTWSLSADKMSTTACPTSDGAPIGVNWTLREVDSVGNVIKEYLNKSFTFKTVKSYNLPGYYYITIDANGNYTTSTGFKDETLCKVSSDSFISNNKTSSIIIACTWYNDIPPDYKKSDPSVSINPIINTAKNNSVYNMLAPFGGINRMSSVSNDPTCTIASGCITNNIGTYLNVIFKLAIGISAALAVIMLIINGITYMGDESIFKKTEAKSKMYSAVFGLLIALGAWALLNTINPALTGLGGLNIDTASVEIVPLNDRGADDPKNTNGESVNCSVLTSGPCSVANLTPIFGTEKAAIAMSKICHMESGGVGQASGTDYCSPPGKTLPFSFGLFQVNLSANGILAGSECVGLFDRAVRGTDAIEPKYKSGYTCSLLSGKDPVYSACKDKLLDTATNLAIAKSLFNNSKGMGNWNGDKKYCASAFQ